MILTNKRPAQRRINVGFLKQQLGVSVLGFLVLLLVVGGGAVLGMKVFPAVREYRAIQSAIVKVKNGATAQEIARDFDKVAQIDDISSITGKDLTVKKVNGDNEITFAYDHKIPLFGPASLLLEFQGSTKR